MKQFILLFAVFATGLTAVSAQNRGFDNFYKKYEGCEDVVSFSIPPALFKFILDKEDDEELRELLNKMDKINFMIIDEASPELFRQLNAFLPDREYHDLMVIRDGSSTITFKLKESGKNINEIIMVIEEKDTLVAMCVSGNFTEDDARAIAQAVKIDDAVKMH